MTCKVTYWAVLSSKKGRKYIHKFPFHFLFAFFPLRQVRTKASSVIWREQIWGQRKKGKLHYTRKKNMKGLGSNVKNANTIVQTGAHILITRKLHIVEQINLIYNYLWSLFLWVQIELKHINWLAWVRLGWGRIWSEILVRLLEKYCCVRVRNTGLSPLQWNSHSPS